MFFYITLHKIEALKVKDHPWDPFNRKVELFQTWHLCEIDPVKPPEEDSQVSNWARQGFSVRGAPNSGSSFGNGDIRTVVDPQITFGLPDDLMKVGERRLFRFDVHYWEADQTGADKVRALFADSTLSYMTKAWEAAKEDEEKAKEQLASWIKDNWQDIAKGLVGAASPAALGIVSKFNLLELIESLVSLALNQGSDYHQMHRYVFELRGVDGGLEWRVIAPTSDADFKTGEGSLAVKEDVSDSGGSNLYKTEFRFRVLE